MKIETIILFLITVALLSCNKTNETGIVKYYPSGDTLCFIDTLGKDLNGNCRFYKTNNHVYSVQEWEKGVLKVILVLSDFNDTLMFHDYKNNIYRNYQKDVFLLVDSIMLSVYREFIYYEINNTEDRDKYIVEVRNIPNFVNSYIHKPGKLGYIVKYQDGMLLKVKGSGNFEIKSRNHVFDNYYTQYFNTNSLP
jgi:hypothetical protein